MHKTKIILISALINLATNNSLNSSQENILQSMKQKLPFRFCVFAIYLLIGITASSWMKTYVEQESWHWQGEGISSFVLNWELTIHESPRHYQLAQYPMEITYSAYWNLCHRPNVPEMRKIEYKNSSKN